MNPLEQSLIEKAGYANGWENVSGSGSEVVVMFSARHKARVRISPTGVSDGMWKVTFLNSPSPVELIRSLPWIASNNGSFEVQGYTALGKLLRRAAELAMSLPNHTVNLYAEKITKIEVPSSTEVLKMARQRIGQDLFRDALLRYWGGCAVMGITVPELLRASHVKPWAACASDEERLNVFNGFLLCAHLDVLFDRGLMTFKDDGAAQFSPKINLPILCVLGLGEGITLRWVAPEHKAFLQWHREHVFDPTT